MDQKVPTMTAFSGAAEIVRAHLPEQVLALLELALDCARTVPTKRRS